MKYVLITTLCAAALAVPAYAQQAANKNASHVNSSSTGVTTLSEGEVRKVDKEAQKITLRHGPIANLGMPPMTMVFQVKDPALLNRVNPGDKVKFAAERSDGAYIVTRIDPLQ